MGNKTIGILAATYALALGGTSSKKRDEFSIIDEDPFSGAITPGKLKEAKHIPPVPKVIPNGCKEYFFNSAGEFSTTKMLKSECVFTCHAINDKNAIKKFKNRNTKPNLTNYKE